MPTKNHKSSSKKISDTDGNGESSLINDTKRNSPENKQGKSGSNDKNNVQNFPSKRESYRNLKDHTASSQRSPAEKESKCETIKTENSPKKGRRSEHSQAVSTTKPIAWLDAQIFSKLYIMICILISCALIAVVIEVAINYRQFEKPSLDITNIEAVKHYFPKQSQYLWKAIASGINDSLTSGDPSSYILLYEGGTEDTIKKLLQVLSNYSICQLSKCGNHPIQLNRTVLESPPFLKNKDYGILLTHYKEDLEDTGVMIIEHLDEIPEIYALAFHSFCDRVIPLVRKTAFFFTMRVDEFVKNEEKDDVKYVEKVLQEKWKGMKSDHFHPLFARLSEMILRVHREE
ncbi:hypothetical protein HHI36_008687 [Cryptolaemus montrouzieri]|uniref:Uncharacterized protein n=1 Tax=Cryptolaemus montrouzieri TaxID=559131 RepID=A0ABD2MTB5_9CUCU